MSMGVLISNIQRFSLQDGPGIRTTAFLMGCSLRCPWCCNPENLEANRRAFVRPSRCARTAGSCRFNPQCPALEEGRPLALEDVGACPIGAIGIYGREYTEDELVAAMLADRPFYQDGGGVTWSGGEALLQANALALAMARLHGQHIDQCMESCLVAPSEAVSAVLPYLDRMICDVKLLDPNRFATLFGGDLDVYLGNLRLVCAQVPDVTFRFPVVPGMTDDAENIEAIVTLVDKLRPARFELFGVHGLAESKYRGLRLPFSTFEQVPEARLEDIAALVARTGVPVRIAHL